MAEIPRSDPLLGELRHARPAGGVRSADEPGAVALLERIIATEQPGRPEQTAPGVSPLRPRRQVQLRRVAIGSVAAAVVAGAVAAGLVVGGSGGHQPRGATAFDLQAVAQHTKAALTAAVIQDVEYSVTKTTYPQTEAIPERTTYEWTNGTQTNIEVVNPSGAPFDDVWFSGSPSEPSGTTEVLYPIHAWWTKTVPITVTQMLDVTGRDIAARIQDWVSSRQLSIVGSPTIDGQKTIEVSGNALTIAQVAQTRPAPTTPTTITTPTTPTQQVNLTMWLDASTYLPVQLTTTYSTPADAGRTTTTTSSVSWLPASGANLAKLQGRIPSGFTHTTRQPPIATGSLPTTAE